MVAAARARTRTRAPWRSGGKGDLDDTLAGTSGRGAVGASGIAEARPGIGKFVGAVGCRQSMAGGLNDTCFHEAGQPLERCLPVLAIGGQRLSFANRAGE